MRNLSIDYLKVILAFFVIFLHLNFLGNSFNPINFIFVNGLFRVGVPLFLLISGYFFYNIKNFIQFKKWLFRVGLLYLIWMIFYSKFWFDHHSFKSNLINIFFGYYSLWYLAGLIFAGCILYFIKNFKTRYLLSLSISLYLIGFIIQEIGNFHIFDGRLDKILNWNPISRIFLFNCLPILIIGYLIKKHDLVNKVKVTRSILLFSLIALVFESFINYKLISETESLDFMFMIPIFSTLIFIYFSDLKFYGDNKNLANFSTALYLIHPLYINIFKLLNYDQFNLVLFTVFCSIISAFILLFLNNRFKYIL